MTFETWWKEHGSLQNDIFNLSFEAREIFKRISKTAWDESERIAKDEFSNMEETCIKLEDEVEKLKEDNADLRQEKNDALTNIETLKDSIRACL